MSNCWPITVIAFLQGILFWPVMERTFLWMHEKRIGGESLGSILASICSCIAVGALLIVPIATVKAVSGRNSLGDFGEYALVLVLGMLAYRFFGFLTGKRRSAEKP